LLSNNNKPLHACLIKNIRIEDLSGNYLKTIYPFQDVMLKMDIHAIDERVKGHFGFAIFRNDDLLCFCAMTTCDHCKEVVLKLGETISVTLTLKNFSLLDGRYRIMGGMTDEHALHIHNYTMSEPFTVSSPTPQGLGVVTFQREWHIESD